LNSELERERHHVRQLDDELKSLRTKYTDVCERVNAATHQLERVKIVLEETSRRCEQLEKEKV
jgi:septal ring factor EnvC (AmiA/AmiB activator)